MQPAPLTTIDPTTAVQFVAITFEIAKVNSVLLVIVNASNPASASWTEGVTWACNKQYKTTAA
jgi:hypothetical protein